MVITIKKQIIEAVVGVDEAGRGALVGNVVAAAVLLPAHYDNRRVVDSKTLSESQREAGAEYIREVASDYAIGVATPAEIDTLNIHHATLLAMKRAITGIRADFSAVWIDGKFAPDISELGKTTETFVKGDALHDCISAASILAKTYRDAELRELHEQHPEYGFATHKGYPTKRHQAALKQYGVLDCHRRSYKTVKALLDNHRSNSQ